MKSGASALVEEQEQIEGEWKSMKCDA